MLKCTAYHPTLKDGIAKLGIYYSHFDDKVTYICYVTRYITIICIKSHVQWLWHQSLAPLFQAQIHWTYVAKDD